MAASKTTAVQKAGVINSQSWRLSVPTNPDLKRSPWQQWKCCLILNVMERQAAVGLGWVCETDTHEVLLVTYNQSPSTLKIWVSWCILGLLVGGEWPLVYIWGCTCECVCMFVFGIQQSSLLRRNKDPFPFPISWDETAEEIHKRMPEWVKGKTNNSLNTTSGKERRKIGR